MNVTIKQLQGGECHLEVAPTTRITEIKQHIATIWQIPIDDQKLLCHGRTLVDEHTVDAYPVIQEGAKINLVVRKPEAFFHAVLKFFKRNGLTDAEARTASIKLITILDNKVKKLSWDEIEKLCLECMGGQLEYFSDQETASDSEEGFGL